MPTRIVPGYPPGIEELFNVLWQQVCGFSAKWRLYLDLFAEEKDRAVINATAPGAFKLIESALRNDVVMLLGRRCYVDDEGRAKSIFASSTLLTAQRVTTTISTAIESKTLASIYR